MRYIRAARALSFTHCGPSPLEGLVERAVLPLHHSNSARATGKANWVTFRRVVQCRNEKFDMSAAVLIYRSPLYWQYLRRQEHTRTRVASTLPFAEKR